MALEEEAEKRMVTPSVQRLTISWPTSWVSSRGAVVLSGPVSRIEAKTLSQPYDSAAIAPDDGGSHIGGTHNNNVYWYTSRVSSTASTH